MNEQHLRFGYKPLKDNVTAELYRICSESTLRLTLSLRGGVQISVKQLFIEGSPTFELDVNSTESLDELKKRVNP